MGCTASTSVDPLDLNLTVELPNPNMKMGETSLFRHKDSQVKLLNSFARWPSVKTLQDLCLKAFDEYADLPFLSTR